VTSYGFYGHNDTSTVWMNTSLPAPALNISAFYLRYDPYYGYDGPNWLDVKTGSRLFQNVSQIKFTVFNQTYDLDYIQRKGTCQPVSDVLCTSPSQLLIRTCWANLNADL
jgi:hypothetical protein